MTYAQAQDLATEWINGGVPHYQQREVRVREFDLGFVCWAEDRDGGPSSDGGAVKLVIARDTGASTLWPALPVNEVVRRYEEAYGRPVGATPSGLARQLPGPIEATSFLLSPPQWVLDAGSAALAAEAEQFGGTPAAEPVLTSAPAPTPAPAEPVLPEPVLPEPARLTAPPVSDRPAGDAPTMLAPPPSWELAEHGEEGPLAPRTPPEAMTVRMPPPAAGTAAAPAPVPAPALTPEPPAVPLPPAVPAAPQVPTAPAPATPVGGYAPTMLATDGPPGLLGLPGAPGPGPAPVPAPAPVPPAAPSIDYAPTMLAGDGPPGLMGLPGAPGTAGAPLPPATGGRGGASVPPPPPPAALRGAAQSGAPASPPAAPAAGRGAGSAPPPPPPGGLLHAGGGEPSAHPGGRGAGSVPPPPPPAGLRAAPGTPAAPGAPGAADLADAATSKASPPPRPGSTGGAQAAGVAQAATQLASAVPDSGLGFPGPSAPAAVPGAAAPVPGLPPQGAPVPPGVPMVGPGYLAVLSYRAPDGSEQKVMQRSEPGTPHPEWKILQELRRLGVPAEQVLELHTELESCDLPGGYCSRLVATSWPNVRITHSAAYGRDHQSRQAGMANLLNHLDELHQLAAGPRRQRPVRVPLPVPGTVPPRPPVPPQQLAAELGQFFGQGVFRYEQRAVSRAGVPEAVAQTLVWAGLPTNFGPFFWAHTPENRPIPTLAELAAERGRPAAPDAGGYLVLGNDYGRQLCVQYGTAAVVAVDLEGTTEAPRFVNSGVPEFVRSLALLGRMWPLRYGLTPDQAGRWTADFQAELAALDPAALQAPDTWWAVLLEQFWDGLL
ncbi:SUKH-4 family immunity protein [Kitasatospora sp. NBC_01287]|nr:SUKH-4 family immunity protein [Kitasatospora sp. NBC_01287]